MTDIRKNIVDSLVTLNEENGNVYVVVVDSKTSSGLSHFADRFPNNFIELGVAEQNSIGVGAGIANEGGKVFIFGISTFLLYRAYEQIRSVVAYNNYSVTVVGMYSGLFYSDQGFTHRQVDDISAVAGLPNFSVYTPYTEERVNIAFKDAYKSNSPSYIRIENVFSERYSRTLEPYPSISNNIYTLYSGGNDILFISYGISVSRCIEASHELSLSGLNCSTLALNKINQELRDEYISIVNKYKKVVFVEEHLVHCGIGAIFSQWMATCKLNYIECEFVGVSEDYAENMSYEQAILFYGISPKQIVDKVLTGESYE